MAYGKNKERKNWLIRAMPLAIGTISKDKKQQLFILRAEVTALMRKMATAAMSPEPLRDIHASQELDARCLLVQKECTTLNSVWREQARMRVKPAIVEINQCYFKRLAGFLRFVDGKIPPKKKIAASVNTVALATTPPPLPDRLYFHVPVAIQDVATLAEFAELKSIGEKPGVIDFFKRVILEKDYRINDTPDSPILSPNQILIIQDIHTRALEKHVAPDFGIKDKFTLHLHLDSRMLPTGQAAEAQALRDGVPYLLEDTKNKKYHRFIDIAGSTPRSKRIRIPLSLSRNIAQRLSSTNDQFAALILEISKDTIGVRLVAGKPAPKLSPDEAIYFTIGRDFGYTNTITLSVAQSTVPMELTAMRASIAALTDKESVKHHIETHQLPGHVRVVERLRFNGRNFIDRINRLCLKIDAYQSSIDITYNQLFPLKQTIATSMQLKVDDIITPDMKKDVLCGDQVRQFYVLFGRIKEMKAERTKLYTKIAKLKKNWFGFLSNVEITLAKKYNAALVREDLTVEAIEKEAPDYKGKSFNKLLNNGSKGQYQNQAINKLSWNGVPEIVIPSPYTSRSCLTHSVTIDKKHRKGESIFIPCCNKHDHADEHAADTIATYLFLRKLLPGGLSPVCDNHNKV